MTLFGRIRIDYLDHYSAPKRIRIEYSVHPYFILSSLNVKPTQIANSEQLALMLISTWRSEADKTGYIMWYFASLSSSSLMHDVLQSIWTPTSWRYVNFATNTAWSLDGMQCHFVWMNVSVDNCVNQVACELNAALLAADNKESSPKLVGLLKLLLWAQDELDTKKVKFPRLTDLARGTLEDPKWSRKHLMAAVIRQQQTTTFNRFYYRRIPFQ